MDGNVDDKLVVVAVAGVAVVEVDVVMLSGIWFEWPLLLVYMYLLSLLLPSFEQPPDVLCHIPLHLANCLSYMYLGLNSKHYL